MKKIAFIQHLNLILDHYIFFSRKQKKVEQFKKLYSTLKEISENFKFENREENIIRDIFTTNMLGGKIQRERYVTKLSTQ